MEVEVEVEVAKCVTPTPYSHESTSYEYSYVPGTHVPVRHTKTLCLSSSPSRSGDDAAQWPRRSIADSVTKARPVRTGHCNTTNLDHDSHSAQCNEVQCSYESTVPRVEMLTRTMEIQYLDLRSK